MKTIIAAGLFLLIAIGATASAHLIDFGILDGATIQSKYLKERTLLGQFYFDSTQPGQWIPLFGSGLYPPASDFGTPEAPPTATATLSWDLTGNYFNVRWIVVSDGIGPDFHLYHPSLNSRTVGQGMVSAVGGRSIVDIAFIGTAQTTLPDWGNTGLLLLIGLSCLALRRLV